MTPMVTLLANPNGLPKASTIWPGVSESEFPSWAGTKSGKAPRGMAISVSPSVPTSVAGTSLDTGGRAERPGTPLTAGRGSTTTNRRPPSITWALVTMKPSLLMTTPEPVLRWVPSNEAVVVEPPVTGPYAVTRIWTTAGPTRDTTVSIEWLSRPRSGARPLVWAKAPLEPRQANASMLPASLDGIRAPRAELAIVVVIGRMCGSEPVSASSRKARSVGQSVGRSVGRAVFSLSLQCWPSAYDGGCCPFVVGHWVFGVAR